MDSNLVLIKTNNKSFHYHEQTMELYWRFVAERQDIYIRRKTKKDPPWTNDPILKEYKFTNVHRSLDRTTIWYQDHIGAFEDKKDIVFATFIHRLFNKIETMEKILKYLQLDHFSMSGIIEELEKIRMSGQSVWTDAHIVTGVAFGGYKDKLYNILHLVDLIYKEIDVIYDRIIKAKSLEEVYKAATGVQGFGPFLGYQYILDMINTGVVKFSHDDFVVAGPGCKRGIRHVYPYDTEISFEDAMRFTRKHQLYFLNKYGLEYQYIDSLGGKEKGIHLADIENTFCEFSKYYKAYHKYGRPRNKFVPRNEKKKKQLSFENI